MSELQEIVLAGITTSNSKLRNETIDNLHMVDSRLTSGMFDEFYRPMYLMITKYYRDYGGLIDHQVFNINVDRSEVDQDKKTLFKIKFKEILDRNIRKDKLLSAVAALAFDRKSDIYMRALQDAVSSYDGTPEGLMKSKETLDSGISRLDSEIPSGSEDFDVKSYGKSFLNLWRKQRRDPTVGNDFLPFYIPKLDEILGGIDLKQFCVLFGASGHYKSTLARNIIYRNVISGKNVVVGQGEVTTKEFMNGIYALHSAHPKFGLGFGLDKDVMKFPYRFVDSRDLEDNLTKVVEDFSVCSDYGQLKVFSFTDNFKVPDLERKISRYQSLFPVDLLVLDEIRHLRPTRVRSQRREEFSDLVLELDHFIKSFNFGKGIRCIGLHKANRKSQEFALENGYYTLRALGESDEFEKAANVAMWVLQTLEMEESNELKTGICKARDAEGSFDFMMFVNPPTGFIEQKV